MTSSSQDRHRDLAEAAWRWVLDQVRWQDGPWIPASVGTAENSQPPPDRDGTHSGIGGLVPVLAEIRLARDWTDEERVLAEAIAERTAAQIAGQTDASYFDGLASSIGVLTALDAPGTDAAVARLGDLMTPDGWPQTAFGPPRFAPETRANDLTLGTAGVLLAALWAARSGTNSARELAERAAAVLMAEAETERTGLNWRCVPDRFRPGYTQMPNLSHGLAGIATALALAGSELDRRDLTHAARLGAEHLVTLGDSSGQGFVVPHYVPRYRPEVNDEDAVTFNWCHGASGTSLLFVALDEAGIEDVAGASPLSWQQRCLHSVRSSGLPERRYPGFWDNDGRCCGTAGVGDVFLDSWQRSGTAEDLAFALHLAAALQDRAVREELYAYWRFVEHRSEQPLLDPGVGWMQGAAGIAAFLFRVARIGSSAPDAPAAPRMDNWWALPRSDRMVS
ncbi:hypothetical protein BH10ACT8_BH10ACT8_11520 [soil metagenome]